MKYNLVNWCEGMYTDSSHFKQSENHFIEMDSKNLSISLGKYKYGLLPPQSDEKSSNQIQIQETVTGSIKICLLKCNAVTNGGHYIQFSPSPEEYLIKTLTPDTDNNASEWSILLTVNPYLRVPYGIPDEEEDPPRHPDVVPQIKLSILKVTEINYQTLDACQLIIGKIKRNGQKYLIDNSFIPPCTNMMAHPSLISYYNKFGSMLETLEKDSMNIIQKIQNKEISSPLAQHIESICRELIKYIASLYFSFRNTGLLWSPIEITNCFSCLAHVYYINLAYITARDREELFNYFYEWEETTPGTFNTRIKNAVELEYDHNNLSLMMETIDGFISTLARLWSKLSQLEYIGQHKESIIISEKVIQQEKQNNKRWNRILG